MSDDLLAQLRSLKENGNQNKTTSIPIALPHVVTSVVQPSSVSSPIILPPTPAITKPPPTPAITKPPPTPAITKPPPVPSVPIDTPSTQTQYNLPNMPRVLLTETSIYIVQEIDLEYLSRLQLQLQYRKLNALNVDPSLIPAILGIFGKPADSVLPAAPGVLPPALLMAPPPHVPAAPAPTKTITRPTYPVAQAPFPRPIKRPKSAKEMAAMKGTKKPRVVESNKWFRNAYHAVSVHLPVDVPDCLIVEPKIVPCNVAANKPIKGNEPRMCINIKVGDLSYEGGCCPSCIEKYGTMNWKRTLDKLKNTVVLCRSVEKDEDDEKCLEMDIKLLCVPEHHAKEHFEVNFIFTLYDPVRNKTTQYERSVEISVSPFPPKGEIEEVPLVVHLLSLSDEEESEE